MAIHNMEATSSKTVKTLILGNQQFSSRCLPSSAQSFTLLCCYSRTCHPSMMGILQSWNPPPGQGYDGFYVNASITQQLHLFIRNSEKPAEQQLPPNHTDPGGIKLGNSAGGAIITDKQSSHTPIDQTYSITSNHHYIMHTACLNSFKTCPDSYIN